MAQVEPMDADEAAEEISAVLGDVRKRMKTMRFDDDQCLAMFDRCKKLLDDLVGDYQKMEELVEEAQTSVAEVHSLNAHIERVELAIGDVDRGIITFTELQEVARR